MSRNCPVVQVMSKTRQLTGELLVESNELDEESLEALRWAAKCTTFTPQKIVPMATELLAAEHVPGLVLIWYFSHWREKQPEAGYSLPVPTPLGVPFEPTVLSGNNPDLVALCQSDPARPRLCGRSHRRARISGHVELLLLAVFMALGAAFVMYVTSGMGMTMTRWCKWLIIVLSLLVFAISVRWRHREWQVMPAGVLIMQWSFQQFARTYHRYTNDDTVLSLEPFGNTWNASLYRPGSVVARSQKLLTELEAVALLAAWQMPAPKNPQPLERDDLCPSTE